MIQIRYQFSWQNQRSDVSDPYTEFTLHDFRPHFPPADSFWRSSVEAPDQSQIGLIDTSQVKYLDLSANPNPVV